MQNVMLDLETMGNGPRAAIIAIGAVELDLRTGLLGETFYQVVDLESSVAAGLEMDASTVLWWMKQDDKARAEFQQAGAILRDALIAFSDWMALLGDKKDLCVWGNGATFDNVVLSSAYQAIGQERPWSYKGDRCYRTVKALFPDIVAGDDVGTKHNALDDAIYQARHLVAMLGPKPGEET